jgi:hypothetical protein
LSHGTEFEYKDGKTVEFDRVERPQLLLENGRPSVLYCGVKPDPDKAESFNIHIKLEFESKIEVI